MKQLCVHTLINSVWPVLNLLTLINVSSIFIVHFRHVKVYYNNIDDGKVQKDYLCWRPSLNMCIKIEGSE